MISRDLVKMFHLYIIMNIIGLIIYYEIETVFYCRKLGDGWDELHFSFCSLKIWLL